MSQTISGGIYVDDPWLSIRVDAGRECVYADWKGFASTIEFRASTLRLMQAIKETNATSTINDTRNLDLVSHEDQLWLRDTWVPLAESSSLQRIAVVVALCGLGKFGVETIIRSVGGKTRLDVRLFNSMEDATAWVDKRKSEG